jgi:hypothetical protein
MVRDSDSSKDLGFGQYRVREEGVSDGDRTWEVRVVRRDGEGVIVLPDGGDDDQVRFVRLLEELLPTDVEENLGGGSGRLGR